MPDLLELPLTALWYALLMAYEVWWALVLGFIISAIVQAWVPKEAIQRSLAGDGIAPVLRATGWGAASSSCSYAAIAIGKSLFQKGAAAASALAFQFASTNLVWELGLVLWLLMGWQFALAEFVGGFVMILLMWGMLRLFVSRQLEASAREHATSADTGHQHHSSATALTWRERLTSSQAWSDVAHNFRGDWQMLWKEISIGFLLAGVVALAPQEVFDVLFAGEDAGLWGHVRDTLVGPLIAVVTFVCSVGNIPLAAVLWAGGLSFAGVLSFIFADLIVLPILMIYRKYYGRAFAIRITGLMYVTMVIAALVVSAGFSALGLVPERPHDVHDMFVTPGLDYKLVLNLIALVAFAALWSITMRRGAIDPVCGMTVDRATALSAVVDGKTYYFCGEGCRKAFLSGDSHGHGHGHSHSHAHDHSHGEKPHASVDADDSDANGHSCH